jgi:hypothetical protein
MAEIFRIAESFESLVVNHFSNDDHGDAGQSSGELI